MIITKLALPRRTFLRGMGATVALPFLDAMVPALSRPIERRASICGGLHWQWRQHGRVDSDHRRRQFRDVADPQGHRGLPRPHGGVHRTSTTSRGPTRATLAVSTRAPRRPS